VESNGNRLNLDGAKPYREGKTLGGKGFFLNFAKAKRGINGEDEEEKSYQGGKSKDHVLS